MVRPRRLAIRTLLALAAVLALATATLAVAGLRLNLSASAPYGVYQALSRLPAAGDWVVFCLDLSGELGRRVRARGNLLPGRCQGGVAPILKPAVALPGDGVVVSPVGIRINGRWLRHSQPALSSPFVAHPYGRYTVNADEIWVISEHRQSFDSRYYGPVSLNRVTAWVQPLWTF